MKNNLLLQTLLIFISILGLTISTNAQNINGSFVHGGITRTYSFYVPASYNASQPVPLVLNLHGYTSNGSQQSLYANFQAIADTANFIVVHPDGTIEPTTSQRFWNFGILGSTVDDKGFLEALVDTISAHYAINQSRVYSVGMSNGGYMSYALACQSSRFAAVGSVTGSMSIQMYNSCNSLSAIPTIHIHGTSDNVVPYAGNTTSKAVEDVSLFWATRNGCNLTPAITAVPNTNTTDGATAERYLYSGGTNGHTVELFKVTGGGHTWPGGIPLPSNGNTCQDFSASKEVWRFFSQHQSSNQVGINNLAIHNLNVYPNPSQGEIKFDSELKIRRVNVIDLQGRLIEKMEGTSIESLNLHHLNNGNYLLEISGDDFSVVKRITLSAN
jgi:polyhydroxybutyrate depolymerase